MSSSLRTTPASSGLAATVVPERETVLPLWSVWLDPS